MSVQFGRWNFDGGPIHTTYLEKVRILIAPLGPEGQYEYSASGIHVVYLPFHTTKESRRESQPCVSPSGVVFTWDGRLDNREDLIRELNVAISHDDADASIAAAAYHRWGEAAFAKLVGDWAVSIWDSRKRNLLLAKDFLGSRHLYYSVDDSHITWCTVLDPLVLCCERPLGLEEEYLAGWLSSFPAAHLTPYVGIHSVPPSSVVSLQLGTSSVKTYWEFDPGKNIQYPSDAGYEEHFRTLFAQSVHRRLRSDAPVLAELSGGMDSSSIVCVADNLLSRGIAAQARLDTVSYYDDSEPNWNERPYFRKVEELRGQTGCHIDVSTHRFFDCEIENDHFMPTPGSMGRPGEAARQFAACLESNGNRIVLSGIGGDETTGGVPTPLPELQDLLVRIRFRLLARQLKAWALDKRLPWFHLLFEAARGFLPTALVAPPRRGRQAAWLNLDFIKRNRTAFEGCHPRLTVIGPLPSFQENLATLDALRRQMACSSSPSEQPYEKRYPFLDRDLLEFLYAIPRDQLVRPHRRRSLMRRALAASVPTEILDRKRKAFVVRGPMTAVSSQWLNLVALTRDMVSGSLGILSPQTLLDALEKARLGQEIHIAAMTRTLALETWLRHIASRFPSHFSVRAYSGDDPRQREAGIELATEVRRCMDL